MKTLNPIFAVLVIGIFLLSGCDPISESIQETFTPKDTVVNPQVQKQMDKSPYDMEAEQQIRQIQQQVMTIVEKQVNAGREHRVERKSSNFLCDADKLKKAETALRNLPQYAGKEIFVYQSAHFYNDGHISIMLRHPTNPKYVDHYEYRTGKWSEPEPEQLSAHADIASRSISLNRISFTNVARIVQFYNEKASGIEGAKPATYAYVSIWDNRMSWFPSTINGIRERYSLQFNEDGTLNSFQQD